MAPKVWRLNIWQQSSLLGQNVGKRPFLEFRIAKPKCSFHDLISCSSLQYHNAVLGKHLPKVLRQSKHYKAYSKHFKTFPQNLDVFPDIPRFQKRHTCEWPNFQQQLYALWQTFAKSRCQLTRCTRPTGSYQQHWPSSQILAFDQKLFLLSLMSFNFADCEQLSLFISYFF